jgi:hypothetical protein|tara:strand:- start:3241 stop:4311 length:1071 start_codon:yes stop_codon:yes gene_type:complete
MPGPARTPKEQRERRRARAAERHALEALAVRIRVTTLDGYEAAHSSRDGDDTTFQVETIMTRPDDTGYPSSSAPRSNQGDTPPERAALLLRIEHLERALERGMESAVFGVAERAAEATRVVFQSRLTSAASSLAASREETRVANARIAELTLTAPERLMERQYETQQAVELAVSLEKEKGETNLRAAADAVAAACAKQSGTPSKHKDAAVEALRLELLQMQQEVLHAREATSQAARQNNAHALLVETMRGSQTLIANNNAKDAAESVDELRRAAIAIWGRCGGKFGKKTDALDAYAMTNSNDVDGATVRLVAAKLRAEAGKETRFATRGAPEKVTPSREPLAARVLLATSLARDVL